MGINVNNSNNADVQLSCKKVGSLVMPIALMGVLGSMEQATPGTTNAGFKIQPCTVCLK